MFLTATLLATYLHLLALCVAIGVMVVEDLTLLTSIIWNLRIANASRDGNTRPRRTMFRLPGAVERNAVTVSLAVLYATGIWLVSIGMDARPDYIENPKLLAKIALVVVLTINGIGMHVYLFPTMRQRPNVLNWVKHHRARLVLTVALSNSLWLYIAFLGIARSWSFDVSFTAVIAGALIAWAVTAGAIIVALRLAGVRGS